MITVQWHAQRARNEPTVYSSWHGLHRPSWRASTRPTRRASTRPTSPHTRAQRRRPSQVRPAACCQANGHHSAAHTRRQMGALRSSVMPWTEDCRIALHRDMQGLQHPCSRFLTTPADRPAAAGRRLHALSPRSEHCPRHGLFKCRFSGQLAQSHTLHQELRYSIPSRPGPSPRRVHRAIRAVPPSQLAGRGYVRVAGT